MKILIVGAGASGLLLAVNLKLKNANADVLVIEKNVKVGKKLSVTGNGRANIGNECYDSFSYRNYEFAHSIMEQFGFEKQKEFFEHIGIKTRQIGNLCYPYSESAPAFSKFLYDLALELGVKFNLSEEVIDYFIKDKIEIITNKNTYTADRLVLATGGKTYKNLGGSECVFNLMKKHKYRVTELQPGLCPIKTKQNTNSISGQRVKCNVSLFFDNKIIHQESGEVLFKNDGLSGIVIFNMSSFIARNRHQFKNAKIELDLFPLQTDEELYAMFQKQNTLLPLLNGYFVRSLSDYLLKRTFLKVQKQYSHKELFNLARTCKHLSFDFIDLYDFENAQITVGGISFECVNKNLSSKLENNVFFIGEMLDNDGLCGGYNLMWAFACALYLGDTLCK